MRRLEPNLEIKRYLEAHGISQTYISRKTGIELPKLNFALNGKRRMTLDEYALICYALEQKNSLNQGRRFRKGSDKHEQEERKVYV